MTAIKAMTEGEAEKTAQVKTDSSADCGGGKGKESSASRWEVKVSDKTNQNEALGTEEGRAPAA